MNKEKIMHAMQHAQSLGADFADIRYKDINMESLRMENGMLVNCGTERSQGYGIRVYISGAMGFAASNDPEDLIKTTETAVQTAKTSLNHLKDKTKLDFKKPAEATYKTPVVKNPFEVSMTEKLKLMHDVDSNLQQADGVSRSYVNLAFRTDHVIFADTTGSLIVQDFCQSTAAIGAIAFSADDVQRRSYINVVRAGFEGIEDMKLTERAKIIGEESVALLHAEECPVGDFDIILTPRQMFLQIHESVGHPTELDRILGSEAAFAGRSFVQTDNITGEHIQYGSEHVNIVADAFCPLGLGTFLYDDEGVPAQRIPLIENGKLVGLQTSRDNALKINQNSSGAGLSDGWRNLPIVRMTNINLLPGALTMDELISGIRYGFIFDENKSWSIDDLRINFQFSCEMAREIKDGKLTGRIFKNPIYAGKTIDFWSSCTGVGNQDTWELVGVPNCGKGQPMQMMRVSHGSSPARFHKVKVGV